MFGLGPIFIFALKNRFNRKGAKKKERMNTYLTNVLIVALMGLVTWVVGWQAFLLIHGSIFFLSGSVGIWLFYVQHTFEDSYFEEDKDWEYVKAAVEGSSFYKLPKLMQFLTGNIGFHHVHHLSPRVPNYKLRSGTQKYTTIAKRTNDFPCYKFAVFRFRLWDEKNKNFVSFKDVKALAENKISVQVKPEL